MGKDNANAMQDNAVNKKLIVTIATGGRYFGDMSLNWALSVKAGLSDDSGIDIGVIYNDSAFDGIEPLRDMYFDWGLRISDEVDPVKLAFETKTKLYGLILLTSNHYQQILFMDADTIMIPGKSVSPWFDELKGSKFQAYTNDILHYGPDGSITRSRSKDNHTAWCNPLEVREKFKTTFLPQIDACFIYFERCTMAEKIFISANTFYIDSHKAKPHFKAELYRGRVLAEMCFNLALAGMGHLPCKGDTWRPIFFEAFAGPQNFYHIVQEYRAFGFAGNNPPSSGILNHYNKITDYYRDFFGIIPKFRAVQKKESCVTVGKLKRKEERIIFGWWHVALMGNWQEVVKEQLDLLVKSGLLDTTRLVSVIAVGSPKDKMKLSEIIGNAHTSFFVAIGGLIDKFEFPTLNELHLHSNKIKHYGWYIHTKGVSDPRGKHWRDYLNHFNIIKWKNALAKLREGYDLCGVKLLQANGAHQMHYSGNFWWYDSEYIKKLCSPMDLDTTRRHNAEFWCCSGDPEAATLSQVMIDHINQPAFL